MLQFSGVEIGREIKEFNEVVKPLLFDRASVIALEQFAVAYASFLADRSGSVYRWEIPRTSPIKTRASTEHEPNNRGKAVIGTFSTVWEIQKLPVAKDKRIQIAGLASSEIKVWTVGSSGDTKDEVCSWHMDVGIANSPGFHFHAQIPANGIAFPRIPVFAMTPMTAMDYLLGELFPETWAQRTGSRAPQAMFWRSLQKRRLCTLFEWFNKTAHAAAESPWMFLRSSKPPVGMFL